MQSGGENLKQKICVALDMPTNHMEGVGSVMQRQLLVYMYALSENKEFLYADHLTYQGHLNVNDVRLEQDWLEMFAFITDSVIPDKENLRVERKSFSDVDYYFKSLTKQQLDCLLRITRRKFLENIRFRPTNQLKNPLIALHLRDLSTGDVHCGLDSYGWQLFSKNYFVPDNCHAYYCNLYSSAINKILRSKPHIQFDIAIVSTTSEDKIANLVSKIDNNERIRIHLMLNANSAESFYVLATADYFIAAHSSFSYLAVLLNPNNIKIRKGRRFHLPSNVSEIDEVYYGKYRLKNAMLWCIKLVSVVSFQIFVNVRYPVLLKNNIKSGLYWLNKQVHKCL